MFRLGSFFFPVGLVKFTFILLPLKVRSRYISVVQIFAPFPFLLKPRTTDESKYAFPVSVRSPAGSVYRL